MRALGGSLLVVALFHASAEAAGRLDQLFASWQEAQRGVRSLVVQFSLETFDQAFNERSKAVGTFRLIRTPTGKLFASYKITQPRGKGQKQERHWGLLHNGSVYFLNLDRQEALHLAATGDDLLPFLEQWCNPFVGLLDRKHAHEKWFLEVVKQDAHYTYLALKPKQLKRSGWFSGIAFQEGRAVLMNQTSETVPKDMPRQLWYTDGVNECTFEITQWRLNGTDAPKLEEFAKPEDRLGWKVIGRKEDNPK